MSDRYQLSTKNNELRALLAKAERSLPLSSATRSNDLYDLAIDHVDQVINEVRRVLEDSR